MLLHTDYLFDAELNKFGQDASRVLAAYTHIKYHMCLVVFVIFDQPVTVFDYGIEGRGVNSLSILSNSIVVF